MPSKTENDACLCLFVCLWRIEQLESNLRSKAEAEARLEQKKGVCSRVRL